VSGEEIVEPEQTEMERQIEEARRIRAETSCIFVPTRRQYILEELVRGITPENRHAEVDFGSPVGHEIL
jgi:antitoxin MazE